MNSSMAGGNGQEDKSILLSILDDESSLEFLQESIQTPLENEAIPMEIEEEENEIEEGKLLEKDPFLYQK
jgi:hypothetical protein